jgi:hypothetical protein
VLTLREFNAAHDRHLWRVMWLFLIFLMCLLNAWLWDFDPVVWVHKHIDASIPSWVAYIGVILVLIALLLLVGLLLVRLAHRDPLLRCPHCKKGLVRHRLRVVAKRCCPRCASEILSDPQPQHAATLARTEIGIVARRHRRRGLTFLLGLLVIWISTIGLIFGAFQLKEAGWIGEPFSIAVACVAAAVLFGWAIWGLIECARMFREKVFCPRCNTGLFPEQVAKSGGCGWCGQRMIAESIEGLG